ncbi:MAG: PqqD family protein [Clostridia bacterium]|nr:PqqD family protein [Clostridia bacterium]
MKIKSGYLIREVAGTYLVVAVGKRAKEFGGMINLNETAATLWKELEKGATEEELTARLLEEYEVDEKTAKDNVKDFIKKLSDANLLTGVENK